MSIKIPEDDLNIKPIDLTKEEENDLLSGKPDLTDEELKELLKVKESKLSEDDFV